MRGYRVGGDTGSEGEGGMSEGGVTQVSLIRADHELRCKLCKAAPKLGRIPKRGWRQWAHPCDLARSMARRLGPRGAPKPRDAELVACVLAGSECDLYRLVERAFPGDMMCNEAVIMRMSIRLLVSEMQATVFTITGLETELEMRN